MTISIKILIALLFIASKLFAQKTYTLNDCYKLALSRNITIQKARNNINERIIDRQTARNKQLPSIAFDMGHFFSYGKNIDPVSNVFVNESFSGGYLGLGIDLKLFSGLNTVYSIKQSTYFIQASEYEKKKVELELLSGVTLHYARLLFNKEQSIVVRNNILATKRQLVIIKEKVKAGKLSKNELYLLNARLNSEQANLITVQNDSITVLQELKQLLNIPYKEQMDIALADTNAISMILVTEIYPAEFIEEILQRHPAIKQAKMNEQIARLGEKIAKSSLFPSLSVGSNLVSNYNANEENVNGEKISFNNQINNNFGQNINVRLHIPIFSQKEFRNQIKKERINIANAQFAITEAENSVISNVLRLINDFYAAKQKYRATLAALEQSNLSYSIYEEKHKLGRASSLELIAAEDILNAAISKHLQSKLELFFQYQLLQLLKDS